MLYTAYESHITVFYSFIQILDGADRIGGRVKNVQFGGISIEVSSSTNLNFVTFCVSSFFCVQILKIQS
jgi:hypothetical protein